MLVNFVSPVTPNRIIVQINPSVAIAMVNEMKILARVL
jgi:hypothetical protein